LNHRQLLITNPGTSSPATTVPSATATSNASTKTSIWKGQAFYYGLVFLGALALAILYTWPSITDPAHIIPGSFESDQNQNIWSLWWVKRAMFDLNTNPYFSRYLYYPYGTDLYLYALEPLHGLIAAPVTEWFGPVAAFSFICISGLALSGLAATALCYSVSKSRIGAVVGGYGITFSLFHFSFVAVGQLEFVALWTFLLYLAFTFKLTEVALSPQFGGHSSEARQSSKIRKGFVNSGLWTLDSGQVRFYLVASVVSLLLAAFTTLYYVAYAATFTVLFLVLRAIQLHRLRWIMVTLARLVLVWAVFGLLFGLFALRVYAEEKDATNKLTVPAVEVIKESVAPASYLTEFDGNSLLGEALGIPRLAKTNYTHYLGWSLLLLALLGLGLTVRQKANRPWPWLLVGLACAALSLGPTLRLEQDSDPLPNTPELPFMPWNWLRIVPLFNLTNTPKRFGLLFLICVGILAAIGVRELLARWRNRQNVLALGAVMLLVLGVGLEGPALPGLTRKIDVPPEVSVIEQDCAKIDCENSAVLDLPFSKDHFLSDGKLMLWGALRQKPLMGGYLSRRIVDPYDPEQSPFKVFRKLDPVGDIFSPGADDAELEILNYYHIRYITVDLKEYQRIYGKPPAKLTNYLEGIVGKETTLYQDEDTVIYRVPELQPNQKRPFMIVGNGWRGLENEQPPKRWIGNNAVITIYAFQDGLADLSFEGVAFAKTRHMTVNFNGKSLPTLEVKQDGWQTLKLEGLQLKKGENRLYLDPVEPANSPTEFDLNSKDTRNLSIAMRQVKLLMR
jgi:hypothetical protein